MARRTGLRSRIERLEAQRSRRPLPRLVLRLCPQEDAGEIVGFQVGNLHVVRKAEETVADCAARAFALAPTVPFIAAVHAKRPRTARERDEREEAARCPAEPLAASGGPPEPVAGVGRVASRAELERFGAIPIPPERLL